MKTTYEVTKREDNAVSIFRDGIWACDGRLDTVCLERGEAHIIDASAPLGDAIYESLDEALTEAMERGEASATYESDVTLYTKQQAIEKLVAAGYSAILTETGLDVTGEGWSVHYDDRGQNYNEYNGSIPSEVEALAVWDDATTRDL